MLTKEFFIKNRNKLINELEDNSMVILFSGNAPKKSLDATFPFVVNKNFYYETGINEADDILLISKINDKVRVNLFIKQIDEAKAKWVGRTLTKEEAKELSGIEDVLYIEDFNNTLEKRIANVNTLYLDLEIQDYEVDTISTRFKDYVESEFKVEVKDIFRNIALHRMVKEKEEIELIQKAIDITNIGINSLMKNARSNIYEYQLEAYFDYEIKTNGATGFAFRTIAGSGKNGAILHYENNNSLIEDDSLILFDLGAEYKLYNADITRTFPVSGKFSARQKEIYEIVLNGQEVVFNAIKPGLTLIDLNNILKEFYVKELTRIGLIKEEKELVKYYYHGVSHHLGLDTHDAALRSEPLKVGSVITVEPGLYIEEESIGIRIENDVLVTEDGYIDLAKDIIRSVEDIENFMKK